MVRLGAHYEPSGCALSAVGRLLPFDAGTRDEGLCSIRILSTADARALRDGAAHERRAGVGRAEQRETQLAARRLVVEFTPLTTRAYRWELQRKMERGPAYDDQFETVSDEIEHLYMEGGGCT